MATITTTNLRANLTHYPPSGIFPSTTNPFTVPGPSLRRPLREMREHESSELERKDDCRLLIVIVRRCCSYSGFQLNAEKRKTKNLARRQPGGTPDVPIVKY